MSPTGTNFSHMTYGISEFIKMIRKNNKMKWVFLLVLGGGGGGGQDKLAWTACPPGVKITRVGGKISWDSLPLGDKLSRGQDKLGHRLIKWSLFIHSTMPYIHPRLDS